MSASIGDHYGTLLEQQLNATIRKKLDETSSFKKKLAGIHTVQDAKTKGFAPDDAQIAQMIASIRRHAENKYAQPHFQTLAAHAAAQELVDAVTADIAQLNRQWQQERKFYFDPAALADLKSEATDIIAREHELARKRFA